MSADQTDTALALAHRLGHDVHTDPPASGGARRWTCARPGCGRAVLVAPAGHAYGTAMSEQCANPDPDRVVAPLPRDGIFWTLLIEDRHHDVAAYVYGDPAQAVAAAERWVDAHNRLTADDIADADPGDYQTGPVTPDQADTGWIYCRHYSIESDCVRIVRTPLDEGLNP